ncbi:sugar transferase [Sphingobacteriales bacterium CHB3]|nr:sugar transferase [Sphingobacteriales bacterium CHB3]
MPVRRLPCSFFRELIWLIIAVASPGAPAVFSQLRTGKGGKRFVIYKFRTMAPNAEDLKKQYAHLNELQWPDFKITDDPRTTKIGRFLRKTSLDELPQLFNILKGEMSLVGPRPTSFGVETYQLWHTERLDVPPGLTGLWQIVGRAQSEFDDRLRLDIAYIDHACIRLDFAILFKTILAVFEQSCKCPMAESLLAERRHNRQDRFTRSGYSPLWKPERPAAASFNKQR